MTHQEKKDYLGAYAKVNRKIDREIEELARWRARATRVTSTLSDMPNGWRPGDRIQEAVDAMVDIQERVGADLSHLLHLREKIEASIASVEDDSLRCLLQYRYIDGLTWEQISEKMHYAYRHVTRMHNRALMEMKEVPPCPMKWC